MVSHLALLWDFFLFMWEFQTNSAWNVRCVFKMMHLILKRTSEEIQYKTNHSHENAAHLSIWQLPVLLFHSLKKRRLLGSTGVHLTATNHVMWFHFQGTFWWEARLQESLCDTVGNVCAGQLRLYCMRMTFLGPLLRWWAETEIGLPAFGGGVTGDIEPFGSDFRHNQTLRDQVDLDWCVHVQVYGVFSLEHDHFVGQKGEAGVPVIYSPHYPFLFTQMIKTLGYYEILNTWTYLSSNMCSLVFFLFFTTLAFFYYIYFWFIFLGINGGK